MERTRIDQDVCTLPERVVLFIELSREDRVGIVVVVPKEGPKFRRVSHDNRGMGADFCAFLTRV